jgi:hypothetical protein
MAVKKHQKDLTKDIRTSTHFACRLDSVNDSQLRENLYLAIESMCKKWDFSRSHITHRMVLEELLNGYLRAKELKS